MRKLRFLRWLCSLSLVASLLSGVAFGAEIPNLDDLGIDPWGDYNNLPSVLPTASPAPSPAIKEGEREDLYSLDLDTVIMPRSVDIGSGDFTIRQGGFAAYGSDDDGDRWEGNPVLETSFAVRAPSSGPINWANVTTYGNLYTSPLRPAAINSLVGPSNKPWYVGRHPIKNGEPEITNRTTVNFAGGYVFFDLPMDGPVDAARSFQILNARFNFGIRYGGWNSASDSSNRPDFELGKRVDSGTLSEVHVLVNGKDLGAIDYSATPHTLRNNVRFYDIIIDNAVVGFDEQRVSSVSIAFVFNPSSWNSSYGLVDCTGGWSAMVIQPRAGNGTFLSYYQPGGQYILSSDSAAENTGLLKSVLEFLKNIVNGITNVAQQIAHLPGLIADEIMGRLRSLFVPTAGDIESVKEKYMTLLEERLGFLWQAMTFITDTAQKFLAALEGSSDYVFNLPALTITLPSGAVTIVQAQTISFDNTLFTTVRTAAGTMVSFVIVLGFLNVSEKMVVAIVSGKSYFDYLKRGDEE